MANPKGHVFPKITKELSPMSGIQESLVDFYGLQGEVKKLREAGVGYIRLAKEISEKYLIPKGLKGISHGCISRWCEENVPNNGIYDGRKKPEVNINVYNEYRNMLEVTQMSIDMLVTYIQDLDSKTTEVEDISSLTKTIKDLSFSLEKQVSRKLVLVEKILEVQEKVYSMMNAWSLAETTLTAVKNSDLTLYANISAELMNNPLYVECLKQIEKSKK